jgi:hypothetical protein
MHPNNQFLHKKNITILSNKKPPTSGGFKKDGHLDSQRTQGSNSLRARVKSRWLV